MGNAENLVQKQKRREKRIDSNFAPKKENARKKVWFSFCKFSPEISSFPQCQLKANNQQILKLQQQCCVRNTPEAVSWYSALPQKLDHLHGKIRSVFHMRAVIKL